MEEVRNFHNLYDQVDRNSGAAERPQIYKISHRVSTETTLKPDPKINIEILESICHDKGYKKEEIKLFQSACSA
jgi:hypothetical protein